MEIKLEVKGMTCAHCENAVTKALAQVDGVTQVLTVDRVSERAVIRGDADPKTLLQAVAEEGYQARIA